MASVSHLRPDDQTLEHSNKLVTQSHDRDFDGESGNATPKKRRAPKERMSYPRKRAVTACTLCRQRKVKCDNERPSCGTCLALGPSVHCNYQDQSSSDLSTFDPASLAILDRVNTILQNQAHLSVLVENLAASRPSSLLLADQSPAATSVSTLHPVSLPGDAFSPTHLPDESSTTLEEALQGPGNCHNILEWPIFENNFSSQDLLSSFYDQEDVSSIREGLITQSRGIREEDAPILVDYFLSYTHIKNPILDPPKLMMMARHVAEEGFKWDGASCLVLITCALASLAAPFSNVKPSSTETSLADAKDYPTAEAYYTAAQKRLGLLDTSVLAVQCMFLVGVYRMYSMRPLRAWMTFNQACAIFQTYLHTRSRQEASQETRRLEQRLYWSCLKSECEMRDEVDLPPSGLAKVNHPDVFPSPPGGTPEPQAVQNSPSMQRHVDVELQKTWYYYLSEIACRRLKNRISTVLHSGSPHSWQVASLPKLIRLAEELDSQVQRWAEHIPGFVESMDEDETDELTYMLLARFLDMKELISRPFLYLAIHSVPTQPLSSVAQGYAERGIDLLLKLLRRVSAKHRHHGSWFCGRARYTYCVVLLAVVRSRKIAVPDEWRDVFQSGLDFLGYWQDEAPDLGVARQMLMAIHASQ